VVRVFGIYYAPYVYMFTDIVRRLRNMEPEPGKGEAAEIFPVPFRRQARLLDVVFLGERFR